MTFQASDNWSPRGSRISSSTPLAHTHPVPATPASLLFFKHTKHPAPLQCLSLPLFSPVTDALRPKYLHGSRSHFWTEFAQMPAVLVGLSTVTLESKPSDHFPPHPHTSGKQEREWVQVLQGLRVWRVGPAGHRLPYVHSLVDFRLCFLVVPQVFRKWVEVGLPLRYKILLVIWAP